MGQFIDEKDQRRPSEFPRISERYRARAEVVLHVPRRWFVGKSTSIAEAEVLDLSVAGALLTAEESLRLKVGMRFKFDLNGESGVLEIRNIRPASRGRRYYGVSFFTISDGLRDEIFRLVAATKTGNDEPLGQRIK